MNLSIMDATCYYYRNWTNLPEVKERLKKERKERDAATNRLRARLYQQVINYIIIVGVVNVYNV